MLKYQAQTTDPNAPLWARSDSHLCGSVGTLKDQLNAAYPDRDHSSDGFLGDARHLAEGKGSDHNPWVGTALGWAVRAGDFDKDGINAPWLAEQLRLAGAAGDPRLLGGGYVIWDGHITLPDFSGWTPYVGDPHTSHVHLSVTRSAACELTDPWPFLSLAAPAGQPTDPGPIRPAAPTPAPAAAPAAADGVTWSGQDARGSGAGFRAELGDQGERVRQLQANLTRVFPAYAGDLVADGDYGPKTAAVLAEFAHRAAADPHTPEGDQPGLAQADGQNIGPKIARALPRYGIVL